MNDILMRGLGIFAIIIIALALSGTHEGAILVQGGIAVAILVVLLRNSTAVQNAAQNLTGMVATTPKQTFGT